MSQLVIHSIQNLSEEEIQRMMDLLNSLMDEKETIMEDVYHKDILVKSTIGELIETFPDLWKMFNDLSGELKWLASLIGATVIEEEDEFDNPYIPQPETKKPRDEVPEKVQLSCKELFHKICRLTHPDKVKNIKMTKYFITAKKLYHKKDQKGLQDLYDLILSNNINQKETNNDELMILISRINIAKEEVKKAKSTLLSLKLSEDYQISMNYKDEETKELATHQFVGRLGRSISALQQQILDFKATYFAAGSGL